MSDQKADALREELRCVLNRFSQENGSNTPAEFLADFALACIAAFDQCSNRREEWYGVHLEPGQGVGRKHDADALAHRLAYRWARIALWRASRTLDDWMEPVLEHCNAAGREDAQEAIAYLRARGLLEQHPERPELVRVREQT